MLCTPNHLAKGHMTFLLRDQLEFPLKCYLIMCLMISCWNHSSIFKLKCSNHNSIFKLKRSDALIYFNILIWINNNETTAKQQQKHQHQHQHQQQNVICFFHIQKYFNLVYGLYIPWCIMMVLNQRLLVEFIYEKWMKKIVWIFFLFFLEFLFLLYSFVVVHFKMMTF